MKRRCGDPWCDDDDVPRLLRQLPGPDLPKTHRIGDQALASLAQRAGTRGQTITDAQGLERAYQQGDAYQYGDTPYVAGSHTARDWVDDFTKIPVWKPLFGGSAGIHRLQMAQKAAEATKPKTVVGHSLGGAVALQMQKENPSLKTRTYGAPVWDPTGSESSSERYRSFFDPVSVLDRGATATLDAPAKNVSGFHSFEATAGRNVALGTDARVTGDVVFFHATLQHSSPMESADRTQCITPNPYP